MTPRFLSLSLCAAPLLAATVACTGGERASSGECPAGEVCSWKTPRGLHFIGNAMSDQILGSLFGPAATAIGGTQEIALEYDRGGGDLVALDLPYLADDDGGRGVAVDHASGSVVTIRGTGSRENYLRILDPDTLELFDRYELAGAAIERMSLYGTDYETLPPGRPEIVWGPGAQEIGIALYGQVQVGNAPQEQRLIDTSMQLSLSGGERTAWDAIRIPNATAGIYPLTVTAGNRPAATLDVEVVADATDVVLLGDPSPTVQPNQSTSVCFAAMSGQRYVYGLTWTFTVNGQTTVHDHGDLNRNCVSVSTTQSSGSITVVGAAGGKSTSTIVTIGAMPRRAGEVAAPVSGARIRSELTAGDRARIDAGL